MESGASDGSTTRRRWTTTGRNAGRPSSRRARIPRFLAVERNTQTDRELHSLDPRLPAAPKTPECMAGGGDDARDPIYQEPHHSHPNINKSGKKGESGGPTDRQRDMPLVIPLVIASSRHVTYPIPALGINNAGAGAGGMNELEARRKERYLLRLGRYLAIILYNYRRTFVASRAPRQ